MRKIIICAECGVSGEGHARGICGKCYNKKWWKKNCKKDKDKRLAKCKKYRKENLERIRSRDNEYYSENLEKFKTRRQKYYAENNLKFKTRSKKYYAENIDKIKEYIEKNKTNICLVCGKPASINFCSSKCRGKYFNGRKSPHWKGGITPINVKIRNSMEYKLWRTAVFERDKYTCIWCGQVGGKLNADHIKRFSLYPELRFAIDNGRTLCLDCHKTTDNYGGKSNRN